MVCKWSDGGGCCEPRWGRRAAQGRAERTCVERGRAEQARARAERRTPRPRRRQELKREFSS